MSVRFPEQGYSYFHSGEINVTVSAVQLPDIDCSLVAFKAQTGNAGVVYIGGPGVTVTDGSTDTKSGWPLAPDEETGWLPVRNLNKIWVIGSASGDDLSYMLLK